MLRRSTLVAAVLVSACATVGQQDEESSNSFDFVLHSDIPLWLDYQDEALSPRHFSDGDSFGCVSEVAFGDWKLTYDPHNRSPVPDPVWWRVMNYGVIHCGALFGSSTVRGDQTEYRPGFAINLGVDARTGLKLWAWEIGLRPGSDYMLFAHASGDDGHHFLVLDADCSAGEIRSFDSMRSSWRTDYCHVPSQQTLLTIAKEAAARPPIGKLEFAGEIPASEN